MARTRKVKEGGNGRCLGRSIYRTPQQEMRAFDKLPPEMRAAFREAIVDSSAMGLSRAVKKLPARALAESVALVDRRSAFEFLCHEFGRDDALLITGHEPRPLR